VRQQYKSPLPGSFITQQRTIVESIMSSPAAAGLFRRTQVRVRRLLRVAKAMPLRLRLQRSSQPEFTADWGGPYVADWSRHLEHLRSRPDVQMLEIGSYEGRSALWFLENILTHETARLTCVDPFFKLPQEMRFDHNVQRSGDGNRLTKIKAKSADVLPGLPGGSFDAIYVDGDHRAAPVLLDVACCWRLLKPSGVMILDDYQWELDKPLPDRPELAIDLFLEMVADRAEVVHRDYQVILRKR
jgi:predicted O-methyltransferase YrrM